MPRPGCTSPNCPFDPIPTWVRVGVAALVATAIVSKPLLNGLGVQSTDAVASAQLVMSFSFFMPVCVVLLTMGYGFYHVAEKSHFAMFCLDVAGLPGTFLAFFMLASK